MARISYGQSTATAYKAVREVPRDGLGEWREAIRRHLRPAAGMAVVDIGAGTGTFSAALADWFGIHVFAVEPSAAMRRHIPRTARIEVFEGSADALPLPEESADGAWISLALHHFPDLPAAAREIRRVLRPGAPVLIRGSVSGVSYEGVENIHWFPETARVVDTFPSFTETWEAFAAAGFHQDVLERVPETYASSLADLLAQVDTLRDADTTMRGLTDEEFERGKDRLRRAVAADDPADPEPRSNWLTLLVLR
jgi:ubiquinone/menaquinone biosynthesis C-methylase UbiE